MEDKNNFTAEDFKLMKKDLNLNNKDIANIIGTSEANVKMQTNASSKLATWAKSMIYVWQHYKLKNEVELRNFVEEYIKK